MSRNGRGARYISMDFSKNGRPKRKEKRTVRERMRRFNPGLVIRMVLGSKSKGISDLLLFSGESGEEDTGGSASEISAIVGTVEAFF